MYASFQYWTSRQLNIESRQTIDIENILETLQKAQDNECRIAREVQDAMVEQDRQALRSPNENSSQQYIDQLMAELNLASQHINDIQSRLDSILIEQEACMRRYKQAIESIHVEACDEFVCPISLMRMRDPVICADGYTYEREEIERYFAQGRNLSPKTGEPLSNTDLIPNIALRNAILHYEGIHQMHAQYISDNGNSSGDIVEDPDEGNNYGFKRVFYIASMISAFMVARSVIHNATTKRS